MRSLNLQEERFRFCIIKKVSKLQESKVVEKQGEEMFTYVSLLSTSKFLTAEVFPMVDSLVHPNWFQATASCFSEHSAEISAQFSLSMTAKH